jgi:hypothetical protein
VKFKTANNKYQNPNKFQMPIAKFQSVQWIHFFRGVWKLEFGIYFLGFVCDLATWHLDIPFFTLAEFLRLDG